MSNPWIRTFFLGRATAEVLLEKLEDAVTDLLSDVGRAEADWRDQLRIFTETVVERAESAELEAMADLGSTPDRYAAYNAASNDVQRTVDELRAEVARLRSELQRLRNRETS
ncbi:MAG: hypothetical protein H7Y37_15275 [Anaerolineae bacterium]|nr:hypothetical protein [Gloeobacterales cyanobacterium ES-bin-313]